MKVYLISRFVDCPCENSDDCDCKGIDQEELQVFLDENKANQIIDDLDTHCYSKYKCFTLDTESTQMQDKIQESIERQERDKADRLERRKKLEASIIKLKAAIIETNNTAMSILLEEMLEKKEVELNYC